MEFFNKVLMTGLVLATALFASCLSANEPLKVKADESYIKFSGVQNKKTEFNGKFQSFSPIIMFDKDNLAASSIRVEVDLASVESGSEKRDGMLKKGNWFDVENTPQGIFVSNKIEAESDGKYKVEGLLSIKGIEQPVTLFMNYVELSGLIELSGNYTLNRLDFKLGLGAWKNPDWVKHEVEVDYKVVLKQ
ncbi:YceI family protein [Kangiella koreensis]|uniref:YceI family protein n=1 Tax=Kangiella koreensis (strain DSM 16069 / JCM 12317 / KCTC 12182 / SW-125) TaxID=523791 RepID=C7RCF5_KANKD|nr:YceI family protein [Kangiella koreensis]ACV26947.1 YceI family protein [Kangiella koreensis DSM 16069]